ncbi:hypothetical protein BLOT_005019 [Blomia tropicalis]|nr:hypothetical protein BLOT_005019 [Blomia tropicalis]
MLTLVKKQSRIWLPILITEIQPTYIKSAIATTSKTKIHNHRALLINSRNMDTQSIEKLASITNDEHTYQQYNDLKLQNISFLCFMLLIIIVLVMLLMHIFYNVNQCTFSLFAKEFDDNLKRVGIISTQEMDLDEYFYRKQVNRICLGPNILHHGEDEHENNQSLWKMFSMVKFKNSLTYNSLLSISSISSVNSERLRDYERD